jgi:hypothetical protein
MSTNKVLPEFVDVNVDSVFFNALESGFCRREDTSTTLLTKPSLVESIHVLKIKSRLVHDKLVRIGIGSLLTFIYF